MEFIFGAFALVFMGFIYLIPILWIIASRRTTGGEKLAWILAVIFVSWFAFIFYLLLAPLNDSRIRQ